MFGGPVAYFFEYLLGIRQPKGGAGYRKLVIAPQATEVFGWMKGSMKTPQGEVAVSYRKDGADTVFTVTLPPETEAVLSVDGKEYPLKQGENQWTVKRSETQTDES
jgi:alpha-L-rhamnosidase